MTKNIIKSGMLLLVGMVMMSNFYWHYPRVIVPVQPIRAHMPAGHCFNRIINGRVVVGCTL